MPALTQLVYTSRALQRFTASDILRLAEAAQKHNEELGVTGILLYGGGRFLQLLEGEAQAVESLYHDSITKDPRHGDCTVLLKEETSVRLFPRWGMGRVYLHNNAQAAKASWDAICAEIARQNPEAVFARTSASGCIAVFIEHFSDLEQDADPFADNNHAPSSSAQGVGTESRPRQSRRQAG